MKKNYFFLILLLSISFSSWSQSISITSVPTTTTAGTVLTVNYKYTVAADSYIYCSINLLDTWTWVSFVAGDGLNLAVAGTDITGTFNITIPSGTTPSANLTANLNYKINIELKSLPSYTWIAGDYPATALTITPVLGIESKNLNNRITVYPNPVTDVLQIANDTNFDNASFRIVSALGETVFKSQKAANPTIDVSNLSSGIYILSIKSEESTQEVKFYKK